MHAPWTVVTLIFALVGASCADAARADDYPARPIRLVTSKERSPVVPHVPTIAESGFPGFDAIAWHGILAPARTPPAIIKKLNAEIAKALQDPETKALLVNQAMQTVGNTPEEFAAFIQKDIATWKAVATAAQVTVE